MPAATGRISPRWQVPTMTRLPQTLDNRHWVAKVSAAILAGGGMTFAIMAVLGRLIGTNGDPRSLSAQALMWLTAVLWVLVLGTCFLFPTGRRAWVVLGGGCVALWCIFLLLRALS
ncbi:hypothetical protein [Gluconobacter sp.]|uniref:hypothetical protein n=1 Tax=Gluconobacter sp. TaxID=1876758 RepID=UPI0039E93EB4